MLNYNTQMPRLTLPEYGRNVQRMIDHCLTIEDRDERNACARSIINIMTALFPEMKQLPMDQRQKLWDHLAIMSDFRLDIDYPFDVIRPDNLNTLPDKVYYQVNDIRYPHYGKSMEWMIERAADMPDGPERQALVLLLANQMKKLMLAVNPEGTDDAKIFKDLAIMSHGEFRLDPQECHLHEFKAAPKPTGKKKKKK